MLATMINLVFRKRVGYVVLAIVAAVASYGVFAQFINPHLPWPPDPSLNPDPNHMHADFAVWIEGTKLDFPLPKYMSDLPTDEHTHDEAGEYLHQYLHLHDDIGHVIHRHKPGLTIGDFLASLGLTMTEECLTLDDFLYAQLDAGWKEDFAIGTDVCTNGKFHWRMYINGEEAPFTPEYAFADLDRILLIYGAGDTSPDRELKALTDDACLYSHACPWRGDPPAENCISDPEIPCVVPADQL
jgi:hypothetical protein